MCVSEYRAVCILRVKGGVVLRWIPSAIYPSQAPCLGCRGIVIRLYGVGFLCLRDGAAKGEYYRFVRLFLRLGDDRLRVSVLLGVGLCIQLPPICVELRFICSSCHASDSFGQGCRFQLRVQEIRVLLQQRLSGRCQGLYVERRLCQGLFMKRVTRGAGYGGRRASHGSPV